MRYRFLLRDCNDTNMQFCLIYYWHLVKHTCLTIFASIAIKHDNQILMICKLKFVLILTNWSTFVSVFYGSVYGPPGCWDKVSMAELFYVDMSRYSASWRQEIRYYVNLNYDDKTIRTMRWQEICVNDYLNYCDKIWRTYKHLAPTYLVELLMLTCLVVRILTTRNTLTCQLKVWR